MSVNHGAEHDEAGEEHGGFAACVVEEIAAGIRFRVPSLPISEVKQRIIQETPFSSGIELFNHNCRRLGQEERLADDHVTQVGNQLLLTLSWYASQKIVRSQTHILSLGTQVIMNVVYMYC